MDLRYSEEYERFRDEVKGFLAKNWPLQGEEAKLDYNQQAVLFRDRAIKALHDAVVAAPPSAKETQAAA